MKKKICGAILIIALMTSFVFTLSGCNYDPKIDISYYNIDTDNLRIGIVSDSQLVDTGNDVNKYRDNLKHAFNALKLRKVNMVLFAGDITDKSNDVAYDIYMECVNKVFGDTDIIVQSIMGNHDYWGNGSADKCRKLFEKKIGHSPWTHYVLNGYHFIGASPNSGSMEKGYNNLSKWLKEQIEIAIADNPDLPVFVMTHNSAKDTVYGSDDWGDVGLEKIFKNYEQVVNISGHLHYSLLDERAIHQKYYTSITTQSVSYTEMEKGKENGSIPPNADITPMGYIMEISDKNIEVQRINFGKNYPPEGYEEKKNSRWQLSLPLKKENFKYTDEIRKNNNKIPVMENLNGESYIKDGKTFLKFEAGQDDDFVHSYKLVWSNGKEQYYFSDFYNGIDNMSEYMELPVNMKKGIYSVKIYALDSWNMVSEKYVTIDNINVI